ncbi:LPXTG cell wall anchor domain-containing protein [Metabacillus bambusae]|uniref:LPXTG cell wall anchor domain-containing protein n=1 Tax=Metabacillus bambusae TaxID=2795218 RepID=UPI001FB097CF|nr:LPXTG cell wall anchor domain-containing protein [Metabacillus bambusae]
MKDGKASIETNDLAGLEKNTTLILDFKKEYNVELSLSKEQIQIAKEKGVTFKLQNNELSVLIPAENLPDGEVIIHLERLEDDNKALSSVYDITISSEGKEYHQFKEEMTIEFRVTGKVNKAENVKVFYYNEGEKKWELVGGTYSNGMVSAKTDHFSTFAVFENSSTDVVYEPATLIGHFDLPSTATNIVNMLLIGLLISLTGVAIVLSQRKRTSMTQH